MSIWEFNAAVGGYAKSKGPPEEDVLSDDQAAHLAEWIDEKPVWH